MKAKSIMLENVQIFALLERPPLLMEFVQVSVSTANSVIAALLVEVERSPELSYPDFSYPVMQIVQKLYGIVMKIPVLLVSAQ